MTNQAGPSNVVILHTFPGEFEATLAKNALEQNGIKVSFAGGQEGIGWEKFVPVGTTLVVAEKDLEEANEILKEAREQGGVESKYPQEEMTGDRFYRISIIAYFVGLSYLVFLGLRQWLNR